MRQLVGVAVLLVSVSLLAIGCGGGGGGSGAGRNLEAGTLEGSVNLAGRSPDSVQIKVDGVPVEVSLNDDGSFTIPGIPEGEHVIDVIADDGCAAGRATFEIEPGRPIKIPPIDLRGTGKIVGVVSKETEGGLEPVAGAEVVARADVVVIMDGNTRKLAPRNGDESTGLIYPPPPGIIHVAFTDENGCYVMGGVPAGNYFVTVMVPGLTRGWAYVTVEEGQETTCDFVLEPEDDTWPAVGTVRGTVLGEGEDASSSPTPIAGAEVVITMREKPLPVPLPPLDPDRPIALQECDDSDDGGSEPPDGGDDWPPDDVIVPPPIVCNVFRTLTDKDGQYSLNVPAGKGTIAVWAPGYVPVREGIFVQANQTLVKDFVLKLAGEWSILPVVPPRPK